MTASSLWIVDAALGALILCLAGGALYARSLRDCVSLFLAFGIVLTLAWARLGAPDLALAEAAIGAGLTGALLFNAIAGTQAEPRRPLSRFRLSMAAGFSALVFALLFKAITPLDGMASSLPARVAEEMPQSGVTHPVTAVLLNFRSWDTFLELAVLLVALLAARTALRPTVAQRQPWTVLLAWSRSLAPLLIVVGGFVLWRGATAPGGAFQAGALLAAGAVMLRLNNVLPPLRWSSLPVRLALSLGLTVFALVAVTTVLVGAGWLVYPVEYSKAIIMLIEVPATLSIAITLTLLVVGEEEELQS